MTSEKYFNCFKFIEDHIHNFEPEKMFSYFNRKKSLNNKNYNEVEKQLRIYLEIYNKYKNNLPTVIKSLSSKIKMKKKITK